MCVAHSWLLGGGVSSRLVSRFVVMEDPECAPDVTRYQDFVVVTPRFNLGPAIKRFLQLPSLRQAWGAHAKVLVDARYTTPPSLDSCDYSFGVFQ
jgi:hypothetical protein